MVHDIIRQFWNDVLRCRDALREAGELGAKRRRQALVWTWHLIDTGLRERFRDEPHVRDTLAATLAGVAAGTLTPDAAAQRLLDGRTGDDDGA